MSTNIQIDVVLQRLQDQAKEVLEQNQQERQQRESQQSISQSVEQIKSDLRASYDSGLKALADLRSDSADKHSSVPDPYKKRRPAAQRLDGAVSGVRFQWGTYDRFYPINSGLRGAYLTVANATRTQVLDWRGVDFPNAERFSALLPLDGGNAMFIWTGNPNGWVPNSQITGNPNDYGFVPIKPENITKAVLVTHDSMREITPPAGLTAKMRAWEALAYSEDQWALTRHFGMLQPSGVYSGTLLYWTPAVFSGLSGATFSATQADRRNYAFMRANYFSKAPRQFLATEDYAAPTYDPLLQQWRVTRFQPETITSPVPTNQLQRANRSYSVKISNNEEGDQFYWAWDWGSPAFCRQQLLALGFTTADLKP